MTVRMLCPVTMFRLRRWWAVRLKFRRQAHWTQGRTRRDAIKMARGLAAITLHAPESAIKITPMMWTKMQWYRPRT